MRDVKAWYLCLTGAVFLKRVSESLAMAEAWGCPWRKQCRCRIAISMLPNTMPVILLSLLTKKARFWFL